MSEPRDAIAAGRELLRRSHVDSVDPMEHADQLQLLAQVAAS